MRSALPAPPPPFRAVGAASLHVTLAFLGWTPEDEVPAVESALKVAPVGELSLSRAILLPPRRPRVMAVSLDDPSGACARCQAAVSSSLAAARLYEPERRPWLPHVTIGRVRSPVRAASVTLPDVPSVAFTAPSVTLYRSDLSPAGARYTALRSWPV